MDRLDVVVGKECSVQGGRVIKAILFQHGYPIIPDVQIAQARQARAAKCKRPYVSYKIVVQIQLPQVRKVAKSGLIYIDNFIVVEPESFNLWRDAVGYLG